MRLRIVTPMRTVVDVDDVVSIRAEDESGAFGVLPGHVEFLTVLPISVISWKRQNNQENHAALRGGVLQIIDGDIVYVSARDIVTGETFSKLSRDVLHRFEYEAKTEELSKTAAAKLNLAVIRQLEKYLETDRLRMSTGALNSADGGPRRPDME